MATGGPLANLFRFFSGAKPDPERQVSRSPNPAPGSADSDFATRLYQQLERKPGNLFFSPASIRMALAMTSAGARGETAAEMLRVLAIGPGRAGHAEFSDQLQRWDTLARRSNARKEDGDPGLAEVDPQESERRRIVLNVVNRIWAQTGQRLRPELLALLDEIYRAPAAQLDFSTQPEASRVEINRWVSENTNGKIPALLVPGTIEPTTRLVLTNAIYFKARWGCQFEPNNTRQEDFHAWGREAVRVPMMHQTHLLNVGAFAGGQLLELAYGSGELSMIIVLPSARDGLPQIEAQLAQGALAAWLASLSPERVELSLPRFKVSAAFMLADSLKALGMRLAFTWPGADLSGIDGTKELVISQVVHQALVEVDELGTEAAAATAVSVMVGGMPPKEKKPVVFRADHPFLFLIRDVRSRVVLFLGRLVDPRS